MRVLILNSPWVNTDREYGVKSGTRWAAVRKRERTMPYFPFPYFMAVATSVLARAGIEAHVKDAVAEGMSRDSCMDYVRALHPELVVIETFTPSFYVDLEFARAVKTDVGSRVAFCGAHATALPEETLASAAVDYVLMGEYEESLRALAQVLADGGEEVSTLPGLAWKGARGTVVNPPRSPIADLDLLPYPDFNQLPLKRYTEPLSLHESQARIVTSRGCPYACTFCVEPAMNRGTYRLHSVPYVIGLIQHLIDDFRIQELYFDDAILTIGRATAIARAMLGHGIRLPWSCWIHWNIGPEGLSLLRRSGCYAVKFGVESADVGVLRQADKASIHLETIRRLIRNCQQNGIRTHGSFMLGLPGETEASLRQTLNLAFSLDLDACQFTIATPLPGTRFYAMAREHGWLVTQDWSQFDALNRCVVEYPECSREQILAAMEEARRRKVRQFLKNPGKAMIYIWKLYRVEGFSRFIRNLAGKVHFALQALVHRT